MNEQPNLQQFVDHLSSYSDESAQGGTGVPSPTSSLPGIGTVLEIAGSGSRVSMDAAQLNALVDHQDPSVAMSGQVGSQVKMKVGSSWLIANVRTLRAGDDDIASAGDHDRVGRVLRGAAGCVIEFECRARGEGDRRHDRRQAGKGDRVVTGQVASGATDADFERAAADGEIAEPRTRCSTARRCLGQH